eukprot:5587815-Alexandrium_andersonii.AAC.1
MNFHLSSSSSLKDTVTSGILMCSAVTGRPSASGSPWPRFFLAEAGVVGVDAARFPPEAGLSEHGNARETAGDARPATPKYNQTGQG